MSVNEKMTAIADAIRAKTGGAEPLGLDAMAQAIAAISGLPDGIDKLACGEFAYANTTTTGLTITHNLGVKPHFVLVMASDSSKIVYSSGKTPVLYQIVYLSHSNKLGVKTTVYENATDYFTGVVDDDETYNNYNATTAYIQTNSSSRVFMKDVWYQWICGTFKDFV